MALRSSKIISRYVFREIIGTTLLCTLILTAILLYGNLSKHDENLFRALSISPLLFLELISLMLPFALSLGLPFGFSLAVIFCVGRWSGDREILGMQSLGVRRAIWAKPIFFLSFFVSLISIFASLQLSPISRGFFEKRIKEMVWQDFDSWIDSGREISFKMNENTNPLMIGLGDGLSKNITKASLSIGYGEGENWKNVRIMLWGRGQELLAIIHAKDASVTVDRSKGILQLFLHGIDYQSLTKNLSKSENHSNYVSFDRWKQPITFFLETPTFAKDIKRLPLTEFLRKINIESFDSIELSKVFSQYNKYGSISCSSISLCPLLLWVAIKRGRSESYTNLFLGVLICLLFFAAGTSMGGSIGENGHGWWISNFLSLFFGVFLLTKKN